MSSRFEGLGQRALTAAVAAPIALGMTILHPLGFWALLATASIIALREWEKLNLHKTIRMRIAGSIYITGATLIMAWLRIHPFNDGDSYRDGLSWILGLFALVWSTDIAAYLSGRVLGGPRIAPAISPNKTWAGLLGGMAASAAVAALLSSYLPAFSPLLAALAGASIALIAQAGDFLESWLKRRAGVKDSGHILPGHGGMLDRIDGLLAASFLYGALVYIHSPV